MLGGYITIGQIRGIPLRVHVATPIGLFVFSGFAFNPAVWAALVFVILVHELGHAALVRRYRLYVLSIDITGVGGVCRYAGRPTEIQDSVIAWGGVLAQAALLVITEIAGKTLGFGSNSFVTQFAETLTGANLFLIAFNLLPIPSLDGAKAWLLFRPRNFRNVARRKMRRAQLARLERELLRIRASDAESDSEELEQRYLN